MTAQGGDRKYSVWMSSSRYTGYENRHRQRTRNGLARWMSIPIPALRTVTNGEIFTDPLGEFTRRRETFAAYPKDVRLRKLAMSLLRDGAGRSV